MSDGPSTLKERLRSDLTEAIKDRDKVRSGTIRMVLTAITEAEVAGSKAVELSDQQVLDVVIREAKKRREAEEAYTNAGRTELAEKEHAESKVLADYLPQQLTQSEIAAIVTDAIAATGAAELGMKGTGKVMAQVTPQTKGKTYTCAETCECHDGQHGPSKWCKHLIATAAYRKVRARMETTDPVLFPAPPTVEERMAQNPASVPVAPLPLSLIEEDGFRPEMPLEAPMDALEAPRMLLKPFSPSSVAALAAAK